MDARKVIRQIDQIHADLDALKAAIVGDGCAPRSLGDRPQTQAARSRAGTRTAEAYEHAIRTLDTFFEEPQSFRFLLEGLRVGRRALTRALAQAIEEGRVEKVDGGFCLVPPTPVGGG